VGKVALGQVYLRILWVSLVSIIPPMLQAPPHVNTLLTRKTRGLRNETFKLSSAGSNFGELQTKSYFHAFFFLASECYFL
jgi:hypothetical protein